MTFYRDDRVTLHHGDCLDVLRTLPDASVDSVVTDPPYGLEFMGKEWDKFEKPAKGRADLSDHSNFTPQKSKFKSGVGTQVGMPKKNPRCRVCSRLKFDKPASKCSCLSPDWDTRTRENAQAFGEWCELWAAECLRVLKPGGHLLAFGGSRTYHRLTCGVEDAGFEIRDCITWHFGSGFPKSLNVSVALDRSAPPDARCVCAPRSTETPQGSPAGYPSSHGSDGAQPRPAEADGPASPQPQGDARARTRDGRPRDGLGAAPANTAPGAETDRPSTADSTPLVVRQSGAFRAFAVDPSDTRTSTSPSPDSEPRRTPDRTPRTSGLAAGSASASSWRNKHMACPDCGGFAAPKGLGTALKPATEFIVVARKPLVGTVAQTVTTHGTGALNIDGCRIGVEGGRRRNGESPEQGAVYTGPPAYGIPAALVDGMGRWPANVVLDEDMAGVLDEQSGALHSQATNNSKRSQVTGVTPFGSAKEERVHYGLETGGASRFFYVAKAPKRERPVVDGVAHPTVKPLALMRWLVRLVTPPGGTVLEPFAGSGTTVEACILEGFHCIAIEKGEEYLPLILERIRRQTEPVEPVRRVDVSRAIAEQVAEQLDIFGEETA